MMYIFENLQKIFVENPASFFALVGMLVIIFFVLHIRKIKLTSLMIIHISMMLALAILLEHIRLYHFPQGGNVTLGAMIPLMIISFRYGAGVGALAGFIFGIIEILQDPFIVHPVQVLFDYPLPFMMAGLAGIFSEKFILSACLVFAGRFLCHFISGIVFFASYAPEGISPIIYSLSVNLSMIIPEAIICCVILKFLPIKRLLNEIK